MFPDDTSITNTTDQKAFDQVLTMYGQEHTLRTFRPISLDFHAIIPVFISYCFLRLKNERTSIYIQIQNCRRGNNDHPADTGRNLSRVNA